MKSYIKQKAAIFMALILLFTTLFNYGTVASAVSIQTTQQSYEAQFNAVQSNAQLSDDDKIKQVLNLLFSTKAANYKDDSNDIDLSYFLNKNNNNFNNKKILNFLKYQKTLRKISGTCIVSDNLTLTINAINIEGDTATVTLYENYSYQVKGMDQPSGRGITYGINLSKVDSRWLITSITCDDESYSDVMGNDAYSVDKAIQDSKAAEAFDASTATVLESPALSLKAISPMATIIYTSYNRTNAITYAYNHCYDDHSTTTTTNYNLTQFPYYYENDCMNFASQCIWAGFGGYATYTTTYIQPMLSDWFSHSVYNGTSDSSESWRSTAGFWSLVNSAPGATYLSTTKYSSGCAYAEPGDIIQIYESAKGWYHNYVVYAVTGTAGSRTTANIWICAHTANRRNDQLSTVFSGTMRTVKINGQYNYI